MTGIKPKAGNKPSPQGFGGNAPLGANDSARVHVRVLYCLVLLLTLGCTLSFWVCFTQISELRKDFRGEIVPKGMADFSSYADYAGVSSHTREEEEEEEDEEEDLEEDNITSHVTTPVSASQQASYEIVDHHDNTDNDGLIRVKRRASSKQKRSKKRKRENKNKPPNFFFTNQHLPKDHPLHDAAAEGTEGSGAGASEDKNVWLTSYSRIPVHALQEFCMATRDYCPPGLPGPPGTSGTKGDRGFPGFAGVDGGKGENGDKGERGTTGSKGEPGDVGPPGFPGNNGDKGDTGLPGVPGYNGSDGLPGPMGLQGLMGYNGTDGEPGEKGDIGAKGSGTSGGSGQNGLNDGQQCIKCPAGPPGLPGQPGSKGDEGDMGHRGLMGLMGEPGYNGTDGRRGQKGEKGSRGEKGIRGLIGFLGYKGEAGPPGIMGPQGEPGPPGPYAPGPPGAMGPPGAKGLKGQKGEAGRKRLDVKTNEWPGYNNFVSGSNLVLDTTLATTTTPEPTTRQPTTVEPTIDPRINNCRIRMVGKPLFQRYTGTYWGAWMKDTRIDSAPDVHKFWFTRHFTGRSLYEYASQDEFRANKESKVYELEDLYFGTGHTIYDGNFFYHKSGTSDLMKYSLSREEVTGVLTLPKASHQGKQFVYSTEYQYFDIAADENGLWVIYNADDEPQHLLVTKVEPVTMEIEKTWNITVDHRNYGNGFVTCGVLYLIRNTHSKTTIIDFAYDLYTKTKLKNVRLQFTNPFQMNNMISYNPLDGKIYSWDKGNQLTYPLLL